MFNTHRFATVLILTAISLSSTPALPAAEETHENKPVPDEVKKAAVDYADTIHDAIRILSEHHVKKVSPRELVHWAIEGLYRRLHKRIPAEIVKRMGNLCAANEADLKALLRDARQPLGKDKRLDELRDADLSLEGIFEHLDPETKQRPLREGPIRFHYYQRFCGIGAEFRHDKASGCLQVVTPIKDGPAYKAGIRAGDVITRIAQKKEGGNKSSWDISTKGLALEAAKSKLIGPYKSKVEIIVYCDDPKKSRKVMVVREFARKETLFGVRRKADDSWDFLIDDKNKIAYVRIANFVAHTDSEFTHVMAELEKQRINGLILDLRGNPGGRMNAAVKIVELFIEKGLIVTAYMRGGNEKIISESKKAYSHTPMICLIDGNSAAVSEIVAACLQDHHRAIVIGERSRGKAEVRHIININGGPLLFTAVAFYRPNGKPIGKIMTTGKDEDDWGVRPDKGFVVKLSPQERKELAAHWRCQEIIAPFKGAAKAKKTDFQDRQLEKAVDYLRKRIHQTSP